MIRPMIRYLGIGCWVLLLGCGHGSGSRGLASSIGVPPRLSGHLDGDLLEASETILRQVKSDGFNEANCSSYLLNLSREIESIDPGAQDAAKLSEQAPKLIENLWRIRLAMHERLPEVGRACSTELKNTFRLLRFVEDYLAETSRKITPLDPSKLDFAAQPVPFRDEDPRYLVLKRDRGSVEFEPGDAMITRGVSFLSAMIARLGNVDSQFSHIVFVAKDPKDGVVKTLESYVGKGVDFYAMDEALKNENARILLLRAKDRGLAARASSDMAGLARSRIDAGNKIKYDYELDFRDHRTMSCAEVSQVAYEMASEGKMRIPEFPSRLEGGQNLLDHLKLAGGETYAPGDLETDSRFELVAEFRDLALTRDSRLKDAILTQMLTWMDYEGYRLVKTGESRMAAGPIWVIRKTFLWPFVKRMLKVEDFSKEVPRPMLSTVMLLNGIGEKLLDYLRSSDQAHEARTGWPMTYQQLYAALDELREKDYALYLDKKTRKQSLFHKLFRPSKRAIRKERKERAVQAKDPGAGTDYPALEQE